MIPRRHRRRAPRPVRPRRPRELGSRVRPTQSVRNGLMFIGQDPPPEALYGHGSAFLRGEEP